jgi:PEGA domain
MQSRRPRLLASSLLCLSWLAPSLAEAEDKAKPHPAPKAASEGAPKATNVDAPARAGAAVDAAPATETAASPDVVAEAKQRFDRGFELYNEGDYPLALIEFNRAYELVPNYRVLYNIGQVCLQLAQYANARRALEEYRDKGGTTLSQDRRDSVGRDLAMLERRTAFLLITSNIPDAEIFVDDVSVGKTPLAPALLVDAGVHRVSARKQGYLQRTNQVTLAGGDQQTLALKLDVMPDERQTIVVHERDAPEEPGNTLAIAGWIGTGALAAGAIVTGILGAGEVKDLKALKAGDPRDYPTDPDTGSSTLASRLDDKQSSARTLLLVSDICSGAALVVGGLSLWFTINPLESGKPPAAGAPPPAVPGKDLQVGYEAGQLQFRGRF